MSTATARPTPGSAVLAWWGAMQRKDTAAIAAMTLDDYLSAGGPGQRTLGREQLLREAEQFLGAGSIEDWSVTGLEVREHGDVAVCCYLWSERGVHQGGEFRLEGVATDVLVLRDGRWRYQAHHVGMLDQPRG
jgi:ketosteroid isomerase-like protein